MPEAAVPSRMSAEIAEIPAAAERLLARNIDALAQRVAAADPSFVVFCGRGSSGHVGVYLRYLFETKLGLLVSAAAPSVVTAYKSRPAMRNVLFIVISQSGRSPDLIAPTQSARSLGALTLAIVNDEQSPVASAAELVLPIGAGPEHAVAATKSVVSSMIAGAMLVAALTRDDALSGALRRVPQRLAKAQSCNWSDWADAVLTAPAAFVAARGYGFGPVREIALKLTETLRIPALAFSAAELRHGPRAAVTPATPVLLLRQNDQAAGAVDELARDLLAGGETVFTAGDGGSLPWIGDDHPICDPISMLVPAYRAIEAAARSAGLDPDNPPHLSKVTRTL